MTSFLALLTSLPTGNSTIRMRVWRALKNTGCGVLRDGVYLLPADAPRSAALTKVESEVRAAGGFAMTVEMNVKNGVQIEHVRKLFDRSNDYGALVARIHAAKRSVQKLGKRKADTLVQRLCRSLDELSGMDFYPGQARLQAREAMTSLEQEVKGMNAPGEPHSEKRRIRRLDAAKYRNRTWATRKDLWVDRLASAWLIRRFIDQNAKFVWVDRPRTRPKASLGFDFDGAEFTHVDGRVTFEVLLASFGLENDAALGSIGRAVHYLDAGGIPVADAKGLESVLRGIKATTRNDDEALREAQKVFDLLYSAYARNDGGQQPS